MGKHLHVFQLCTNASNSLTKIQDPRSELRSCVLCIRHSPFRSHGGIWSCCARIAGSKVRMCTRSGQPPADNSRPAGCGGTFHLRRRADRLPSPSLASIIRVVRSWCLSEQFPSSHSSLESSQDTIFPRMSAIPKVRSFNPSPPA
jgi:hypothetical protein